MKALNAARARLDRLERTRSRYAETENALSGLSGDLRGAETRGRERRTELEGLEKEQTRLAKLLPLDAEYRRVSKAKEALDKASGKYEERVQLEGEIANLKRQVASAERELHAAQAAEEVVRGAAETERTARKREAEARKELARLQEERGEAQRALGSTEEEAEKVKKTLSEIRRRGPRGKCPTCYRTLGESLDEILSHLAAESQRCAKAVDAATRSVARLDAAIRATNRRITAAGRELRAASSKAKTAARAEERVAAARKAYAQAVSALRRKHARLRTLAEVQYDEEKHRRLEAKVEQLSEAHDEAERLRQDVGRVPSIESELRRTVREIGKLRAQVASLTRRRTALRFDPVRYDAAKEAYGAAQKEDKEAALAHTRAAGDLEKLMESQRRLSAEIDRLEQLRAGIARQEELIRYLTRVIALLDDFRVELINRVRPQIAEYASRLFEQVSEGRYTYIVLDEDYNIFIQDESGTHPLRRFSGGEEDLANLCLRIAISQVVGQRSGDEASSLIVLDEVFGSQDAERREQILHALGRLQETFQQIVIVTHMEDTQERVSNVLRVIENSDREAEAVWA